MRLHLYVKHRIVILISTMVFLCVAASTFALPAETNENLSIDRIQLVSEQINLLKNRIKQAENELSTLQKQGEQISQLALEKASKSLLDKAALDITVAKSNVDSINVELADSQQTSNWLEKNIQEIENQLNVLNMFGLKIAPNERANLQEYRHDLSYQQQLLQLEKVRIKCLQQLQTLSSNMLIFKKDKYKQLNALLKSRNMLRIKQQQVKDELAFQEQQNHWLNQLNILHAKLLKIDPVKSKSIYTALERDIFYANENANFAYIQSLIARYKDQLQQMKLAVFKSSSISLLNEISNQLQTLTKQIGKLNEVLHTRVTMLEKHITYLSTKKKNDDTFTVYVQKLSVMNKQYELMSTNLDQLSNGLFEFRKILDQAIQNELSSRQGFPTFDLKSLLELGKELLLVPALTFQIIKSISNNFVKAFQTAGPLMWMVFIIGETLLALTFLSLRKSLIQLLERPSVWRDQINSKWLGLQWLRRNFLGIVLIGNFMAIMYLSDVPQQNQIFLFYLALVWLSFKSILTIARVSLVETTHDTSGHDVRLYRRLRWIIIVGGFITALTVFVHRLPFIYELKTLCDGLFLFLLLGISLLLLRSWEVVPNLILSHMESQHPYLQKSIRLVGILIPVLLLTNSVIGLLGYINLILTISWYEGVFLVVLVGYLILRGLLSDGMEQLSRMMIQYSNNGWLWTEAFLKPLDNVLRITLFLSSWALLFLLYGWDKQSPIVERLTRLLHYQLANILNTTITPISILELLVVISIFYWTAKWIREFAYRLLLSRTKDLGIRNSIAILSQYIVVMIGILLSLRVLGIDLRALTFVAGAFAFGIGLGLRDLANNFVSGFLLLLERPLRVGDMVTISGSEGEVMHIGSRAVTIRTWDHMELLVPNSEIFNKSFTNWTAMDNIVRAIGNIKISRYDNPHQVKVIIQNILASDKDILKEPVPEVLLKEMSDTLMEFEFRYYVNIRQVKSRISVMSAVFMNIWDTFAQHGIKPPYPQHEIYLRGEIPKVSLDHPING